MSKPLLEGSLVYVVDPDGFDVVEATVQSDPGDEHIWVLLPRAKRAVFTGPHRWAKTLSAAKKLAAAMIDERVSALQSEIDSLRAQRTALSRRS